jgi:hypothetical protein
MLVLPRFCVFPKVSNPIRHKWLGPDQFPPILNYLGELAEIGIFALRKKSIHIHPTDICPSAPMCKADDRLLGSRHILAADQTSGIRRHFGLPRPLE